MDLVFVDKLANQNNGVKYLLIGVEVLPICQSSNNANKISQKHFASFQKIKFSKNFRLIKEQNMGELSKSFTSRKTLKFTHK